MIVHAQISTFKINSYFYIIPTEQIMNSCRNRDERDKGSNLGEPAPQKKNTNHYKALYKMSKERKARALQQEAEEEKKQESYRRERDGSQLRQGPIHNPHLDDSLQNIRDCSGKEPDSLRKKNDKNNDAHIRKQSGSSHPKKRTHNRSHSCPFIAPLQSSLSPSNKPDKIKAIPYRKAHEGQSRRTLKKKSAHFYLKHQKHPNNGLNRKNREGKAHHRNSNSQISQESNTIIVHTLPIQQLSSMLYSSNSIHKDDQDEGQSQTKLAKQIFSIHNDLYFQTRLQQQIKMYDLNEQMESLQKEAQNVQIKQQVLEKLANQFQMHRLQEECGEDCDDSLLIHS